ncbi:hypothetical protein Cl131_gp136 [Aphanizomenon phage vB_AphaS-CL131]|nr:hypothetical protein Cl131_gp136 [Aphanizomenon phage vB_AphaS-CL131]
MLNRCLKRCERWGLNRLKFTKISSKRSPLRPRSKRSPIHTTGKAVRLINCILIAVILIMSARDEQSGGLHPHGDVQRLQGGS